MTGLPDKTLLLVSEVAEFFRVTERTVRIWIEHGHLEAERTIHGRGLRITRESILKCRFSPSEIEKSVK